MTTSSPGRPVAAAAAASESTRSQSLVRLTRRLALTGAVPAARIALAVLGVLGLGCVLGAVGLVGTAPTDVAQVASAIAAASFGAPVSYDLLLVNEDEHQFRTQLSALPLSLTLATVVVLGALLVRAGRRRGGAEVASIGVMSGLLVTAGVIGFVRVGRWWAGGRSLSPGVYPRGDELHLSIRVGAAVTDALPGLLGALALAVVGATLISGRLRLPAPLTSWRRLIGGPAWVLTLAGLTVCGLTMLSVLTHPVQGVGAVRYSVASALALPNAAMLLTSLGLGPGLSADTLDFTADALSEQTQPHRSFGLSNLALEWGPLWWLVAALALIIALTGLLLAARYPRARDSRRASVVAGAMTLIAVAGMSALSSLSYQVDFVSTRPSRLGLDVPALQLGLWAALLVTAAGLLAGVLAPVLPPRMTAALAALARQQPGDRGVVGPDGRADGDAGNPGGDEGEGSIREIDLGLWLPDPPRSPRD